MPTDINYKLFLNNPDLFWRFHPTVRRFKATDPDSVKTDFVDLLNKMFSSNLAIRPQTIIDVLSHSYFTEEDLSDSKYAQEALK